MTRDEQANFVKSLCDAIYGEILNDILTDNIPEHWDGHELRALIADRAEQSASMSLIRREPQRKRAKDFRNEVLVRAL